MNHLLRERAPVTEAAWEQIDEEACRRLRTYLAARRLIDFRGPSGWGHSAHDLGRTVPLDPGPGDGVTACLRRVQPLVELRAPFRLERSSLDDAERGDAAVELEPLAAAARQIALAENTAVFHGYPAGGIVGMADGASSLPAVSGEWANYRQAVASAVARLQGAGIGGPYGLALGDEAWLGVSETVKAGYPLLEHLSRTVGEGPVVWAPGLEGAVVASQRGGDFLLDVGQDLAIGYLSHDDLTVTLYLEESFTFRVLEPAAVITIGV